MTNTRLEEERLRELYERVLDARSVAARERCTSPEAMLALVRREGSEEDRLATLDHVMACTDCAREFELVRAIEDAGARSVAAERGTAGPVTHVRSATDPAGRVVSDGPRTSWRRYAPVALAASVLLAVGLAVLERDDGPGEVGVMRGEAAVMLVAPPNEVRSVASGVHFVWRPVAGAVSYQLEVLDSAGGVMFSTTTRDTTLALTDARRLTPGAEYRWWVRAVDGGGAQRASEMRRLRVRSE